MEKILFSWIGGNDLKAFERYADNPGIYGPVLSTLLAGKFTRAYLLYNYSETKVAPYLAWLRSRTGTKLESRHCELASPIDFGEIHQAADSLLAEVSGKYPSDPLAILLSPGTPAMQAVWILLGKTRYPCTFYQSSLEQGVQRVEIPFHIAAEFVPEFTTRQARHISALAAGSIPVDAAFNDIITQNPTMEALKAQASIIAARDVPVLIYGETGTGKELFATAIHNASPRHNNALVTVNCGAIPSELIDSTLFGHVKGAFTGAISDKPGYFEAAHDGTLFLDEFAELPLDAQVRLLRVLQSGELTPVGAATTRKVNVRLITATNKDLLEQVAAGRFREDLFYRIAIGVLHLPPLRERHGDLALLADALIDIINRDAANQPGYTSKRISVKARQLILRHPWRGNVRELYSTLLRASLWSTGDMLQEQDLVTAMFQPSEQSGDLLQQDIGDDFDIQSVIDEVVGLYINRALQKTAGNKTRAAKMIGLNSSQTLSNWIKRHKVTPPQG